MKQGNNETRNYKGKIVIVEGKKAKVVKDAGDSVFFVFQENGKYRGEPKQIAKEDVLLLSDRKKTNKNKNSLETSDINSLKIDDIDSLGSIFQRTKERFFSGNLRRPYAYMLELGFHTIDDFQEHCNKLLENIKEPTAIREKYNTAKRLVEKEIEEEEKAGKIKFEFGTGRLLEVMKRLNERNVVHPDNASVLSIANTFYDYQESWLEGITGYLNLVKFSEGVNARLEK